MEPSTTRRYFYPRSPCGERLSHFIPNNGTLHFYPRSPCGERRLPTALRTPHHKFLSTLSLRRATWAVFFSCSYPLISIHALLAESDHGLYSLVAVIPSISIHALLAESDLIRGCLYGCFSISIHALLAESDRIAWEAHQAGKISIHALLAESDRQSRHSFSSCIPFLSTLSLRRATIFHVRSFTSKDISIHALLAESDAQTARNTSIAGHFYPRSPCGERLFAFWTVLSRPLFLSTLSLRRATCIPHLEPGGQSNFYPRSPCGERHILPFVWRLLFYFYPRSPCGERRAVVHTPHWYGKFLSTLSLRRATLRARAPE